jgi:hypothetical protein
MRTLGRGLLYWLALIALFAVTRDVALGIQGLDVKWGYTTLDVAFFVVMAFWLMRAPRRVSRRGGAR